MFAAFMFCCTVCEMSLLISEYYTMLLLLLMKLKGLIGDDHHAVSVGLYRCPYAGTLRDSMLQLR